MKFPVYTVIRCGIIVMVLVLDLTLMLLGKYFTRENREFGLTGVVAAGDFYEYSQYGQVCSIDLNSKEICENLENLEKAGLIVKVFLGLDLLIAVNYALFSYLQHFYVKRFIARGQSLEESSKLERVLLTCSYKGKGLVLLHPVFINLALGLWVNLSHVEKFSSQIVIAEGLILLIFQAFFSLLVVASYCWEVSVMKRRNQRLNKNFEKKGKQYSIDLNTSNICVRIE